MNKEDFIKRVFDNVSEARDLSKAAVKDVTDSIFDTIKEVLKEGNDLQLIGFGSFRRVFRKESKGINPQTKQPMVIPAKNVVKFKRNQ